MQRLNFSDRSPSNVTSQVWLAQTLSDSLPCPSSGRFSSAFAKRLDIWAKFLAEESGSDKPVAFRAD